MGGKRRKPGDWMAVAKAHAATEKIMLNGQGLSNVPRQSDTGSAAYRRLKAKQR